MKDSANEGIFISIGVRLAHPLLYNETKGQKAGDKYQIDPGINDGKINYMVRVFSIVIFLLLLVLFIGDTVG